jgi:hypothetical protein
MIEHQTASALQAMSLFLAGRIVDHPGDAIVFAQLIDHILPAFATTRGRIHRIEHHTAVMVRGQPVVRENGVRFLRRGRVVDDVDGYARIAQHSHGGVELAACPN